ncbi:MAG: hypothetical protein WD669_01155 [Pirellulales bacterium]
MPHFARRRIRNAALTLLVLAAIWAWIRAEEHSLRQTTFATGYLLLAAVGFLVLYGIRKRLPFLPLGSSTAWLQWHLYVGIGTLAVFAMHVKTALPNGILETTLAVVYLLTFASGVIGLYLTRTVPPQLARLGQEVIYERIPALRRAVWRSADDAVLAAVAASGATTLADFYTGRLYDFFARPRPVWYQLRPTTAGRRALLGQMQDVRRYLSDQEQGACEELFALVRRKDDLDFQEARQKLLKVWLFAHIGLTYVLVLLALLHALLAHAFQGGAV